MNGKCQNQINISADALLQINRFICRYTHADTRKHFFPSWIYHLNIKPSINFFFNPKQQRIRYKAERTGTRFVKSSQGFHLSFYWIKIPHSLKIQRTIFFVRKQDTWQPVFIKYKNNKALGIILSIATVFFSRYSIHVR